MSTYSIIRLFESHPCGIKRLTLDRRRTQGDAQAHCTDPESNSKTCSAPKNVRRTEVYGNWHDECEEESE